MSKEDFDRQGPKFLPTEEQVGNSSFDVDQSSAKVGIDSQLKVKVTASKDGAEIDSEVLNDDAVIIVDATDSTGGDVLRVGPTEAFSTIQSAINTSSDGDSIMVADGTYREAINFKRKKITITGNVNNPSQCIIDGRKSENGDPVEADWSRPFSDPTKVSVVTVDTREPGQCYDGDAPDELDEEWSKSLRVLEGFQIQNGMQGTRYPGTEPGCEPRSFNNGCVCDDDCVGPDAPINCIEDSCGNASCQTNPPPDHCSDGELPFMGDMFVGGGLWAYRSKLTVRNCNFIDNISDAGTGAFARECDVSFTSCEFTGNISRSNGGGLQINHCKSFVSDCTLTNNVADGSAFPDGAGYGNGGGLHQFSGQAVIQNCTFTNNTAKLIGGVSFATGLVPNFQHTHGDSTLSNCTIEFNNSTGTETIDPKCGGVAITTQDSDSDGDADATVTISNTKMCNNISGSDDSDFDPGDISSAWTDGGDNEICVFHDSTSDPVIPLTLDSPFNGLDQMIIDARLALGEESAILVLSGTGTEGEVVELQDNTTGNWNPVAVVDENGFWKTNDTDGPGSPFYEAATVSLNRNYDLSDEWYKVRVRYKSDEIVVESENTFLPGFVFMSVSQSERAQMFSWSKDNWPVESFPINNNHNFQLLQHRHPNTNWFAGLGNTADDGNGGITGEMFFDENGDFIPAVKGVDDGNLYFAKVPERFRISLEGDPTQTNQGPLDDPDNLGKRISRDSSTQFTTTLKHMANMFNETMPNIPVLFVDNQWSGSSRASLLKPQTFWNRQRVTRDFRFTKTCVDWCRSHGTEIGVVDDMWYASDSGTFRFDCKFGPLFSNVEHVFPGNADEFFPDGINVTGVTVDYVHGRDYPPGANNNDTDDIKCWASYFDASAGVEAHELGVGICRKDRTRWALMSTNRFSSVVGPLKEDEISVSHIYGAWGSHVSNTEVVNAKSPQQTMINASQRYEIIGGVEVDVDPDDPDIALTSTSAETDFDSLTNRSRGRNLPRLRRCVFNLANHEHNYFLLPSFDPTVVCHGEMAIDADNDGFADTWADDPHPCGNIVERRAFPKEGDPVEYDMTHPDADIVNDFGRAMDGQMKMAEYTVLSAARTAGETKLTATDNTVVDIPIPVFDLETPMTSNEAVFSVKDFNGNALPQGSSVETLFTVRGEPDLTDTSWLRDTDDQLGEGNGLEHPNYKKIIGFELDTGSGFTYGGFETDFGDDGLSVKVIPDVPFKNGDVIRFNGGGCDSAHLWQSDCMHRIYRGMAILSIPGISTEGIPISAEPRTPIVTVSGLP